MDDRPIIAWLRRDLRLGDNPLLAEAAASGRPVIPAFLFDEAVEAMGAAPRFRLGLGLEVFAGALDGVGSRLLLLRGEGAATLRALARETGGAVWWSRLHDPQAVQRDAKAEAALRADGVEVRVLDGHLLHTPERVATTSGGFFKVYTPFWNAVRDRDIGTPVAAPKALRPPAAWPSGEALASWRLSAAMQRGAAVVAAHVAAGEGAAEARLSAFLEDDIGCYDTARNLPAAQATSRLSDHLALGEISVRRVWHGAMRALHEGRPGAQQYLKELVWRDFAHHLLHHTPRLADANWREGWDAFPWRGDSADAEAWRRGRTGVPMVDAAMREMFVTGRMHNRARMIVASFLTKHLLTDWRIGSAWFEDCLVDWDPANNALGWQWVAGSGPDAAPFFRVFNAEGQREKFDPDSAYVRHWIAEGQARPSADALGFFEAAPRAWGLSPADAYPAPIVDLKAGRERALAAYHGSRT